MVWDFIKASRLPVIDFTSQDEKFEGYNSFDWFSPKVIKKIDELKSKGESTVIIVDFAVQLKDPGVKGSFKLVKDHINLSTQNPLLGKENLNGGPRFFAINELYHLPDELKDKLPLSVLVCLNSLAEPTEEQSKILLNSGATDYGYDLVLASLVAAHRGLKVIGLCSV
jgi:purine-nucleoside phosphorylase